MPAPPPEPAWTAAQTAWGEARGEGRRGMHAVLNVIGNRAANPCWWGHDIASVCLEPWQFSTWDFRDPNRAKLLALTTEDEAFTEALQLAEALAAGQLPDITAGADSYYADTIPPPAWTATARQTKIIGHHIFYQTRQPLTGKTRKGTTSEA